MQHTVVVPIGNEKPTSVWFDRELHTGRNEERSAWWIIHGERANVGNNGEARWTIHSIDSDDTVAADVWPNERDERICGRTDERDVDSSANADNRRWQPACEGRYLPSVRIDA